jgi:hypothetical protein
MESAMQYADNLQELLVLLAPIWLIAAGLIVAMLVLLIIVAVAS